MIANLYEWIRQLSSFLVLTAVAAQLAAGESYRKYIRLYTGILLVLLILSPVMSLFGGSADVMTKQAGERFTKAQEELEKSLEELQEEMPDPTGESISASGEASAAESGDSGQESEQTVQESGQTGQESGQTGQGSEQTGQETESGSRESGRIEVGEIRIGR